MTAEYKPIFNDDKTPKQRVYEYLKVDRDGILQQIYFKLEFIELHKQKIARLERKYTVEFCRFQHDERLLIEIKSEIKDARLVIDDAKDTINKLITQYIDKSTRMTWFSEDRNRDDD